MWRLLRHREPAQIAVIAPFAVIALIGILGLVLDIGVFRLIDSELENAADAAALAAAWYDPVCPGDPADPANRDPRCAPGNQPGQAAIVASRFGQLNLNMASVLCGSTPVIDPPLTRLINAPRARAVTVVIHCHAEYLAGRVLGLDSGIEITRWGTAAIGEEHDVVAADGTTRKNLGDYSPPPGTEPSLIAALVP